MPRSVATPVIRLMSEAKERNLRRLLPSVDDEGLRRVLADPSLILYTDNEMPRAYQVWDGQLQGVHLASYNISANESEPYGNGNHEFPWGAPAGTHRAGKASSFRFIHLPRDERGKLRPIAWYTRHLPGDTTSSYAWIFPVGAVVGEVLLIDGPDGYSYTYEVRLRFRKRDRWGVDVFRPFPTAEDLARRIRELRPRRGGSRSWPSCWITWNSRRRSPGGTWRTSSPIGGFSRNGPAWTRCPRPATTS